MPLSSLPHVRGLVLAAGSGSRMGRPKALIRPTADGPTLVERAVDVLLEGGCGGVTIVVGAAAATVAKAATDSVTQAAVVEVVECPDWAEGMGASLRAGLGALACRPEVDAVVITLVDLPDVGAEVVRRLLGAQELLLRPPEEGATAPGWWRAGLSRAAYGGVPGHPTLIGRDHWDGVLAVSHGDRGARDYFGAHPHALVECGDLATGRDVDTPSDLGT